MKTKIKKTVGTVLAVFALSACAQKQESAVKDILKDPSQQEEVLTLMVEDHDLGKKYIAKMMDNDHAMGMMVDELVKEETFFLFDLEDFFIYFKEQFCNGGALHLFAVH